MRRRREYFEKPKNGEYEREEWGKKWKLLNRNLKDW